MATQTMQTQERVARKAQPESLAGFWRKVAEGHELDGRPVAALMARNDAYFAEHGRPVLGGDYFRE
jgi:hypothetical protein